MVIGIDIRVLGSEQKTGVQEYTENLLAHMLGLDPTIEYKLFYSSYRVPLKPYPWLLLPNVRLFSYRIPNRLLLYASRAINIPKLDRMIRGAEVFFSPHFLITALSPATRRVTTFHDLSFELFPEFFSRKQWLWHQFVSPAWQARFSDRIITVSESTKHDLTQRYQIDPTRVTPVHSGVALQFERMSTEAVQEFRVRHHLPQRFILYLGTFEPRKNIQGLIRAFGLLKEIQGNESIELVLAGAHGWLDEVIYGEIKKSSFAHKIHVRQNIADMERPGYYNAAELFVYPSFFEGFGLPVLEAMACGAPVVASNTSSLPEVVGNAGVLVSPYNVSELAGAIQQVLHEPGLREYLREKGYARARQFSWETTAVKTLEVLTRP